MHSISVMLSSLKKIQIGVPFLPMEKKKYNLISYLHALHHFDLLLCLFLLLSVTVLCGYSIIDQRLERRCKAWVILKLHFYLVLDCRKLADSARIAQYSIEKGFLPEPT